MLFFSLRHKNFLSQLSDMNIRKLPDLLYSLKRKLSRKLDSIFLTELGNFLFVIFSCVRSFYIEYLLVLRCCLVVSN